MIYSLQVAAENPIPAKNHFVKGLEYVDEKDWKGPFFFIQMADCQLGFIDENASWDKEIDLLKQAVHHINRLQPKFVLLCGDITHAFPHEPMRADQVRDFKNVTSQINPKITLVCLCGNHDVGNSPDEFSISTYEADFGSHYFSFWKGGVQGIVVNSALIWDPSNAEDLYQEQLEWFEKQLHSKQPVHRLVFSHHPWFLDAYDEGDKYFVIPKARRIEFLEMMEKANVSACFCGHYHRNNIAQYKDMPIVTTSAVGKQLGKDLSGFRIVKVFSDNIEHEYYDFNNVPSEVDLHKDCNSQ